MPSGHTEVEASTFSDLMPSTVLMRWQSGWCRRGRSIWLMSESELIVVKRKRAACADFYR